jgi:hypothetical protein
MDGRKLGETPQDILKDKSFIPNFIITGQRVKCFCETNRQKQTSISNIYV